MQRVAILPATVSANTDVSNIRKWTNAVDINKEIIFGFFNCW
jgi:hypothetical protein